MDININYSEDDNPVALKADFILSLCELIVGSKDGLQPVEKTVIDRCVHQIYQRYFDDPKPENMPILEDLYNALLKQEEKEAHHVATALEIYVKGSLKVFNHRTNVDIQNRLVCYDIKELGNQLKKSGCWLYRIRSGDVSPKTVMQENLLDTISTSSICCSKRNRPQLIPLKFGSDFVNGAAFRPVSPRM